MREMIIIILMCVGISLLTWRLLNKRDNAKKRAAAQKKIASEKNEKTIGKLIRGVASGDNGD